MVGYVRYVISELNDIYYVSFEFLEQDGLQDEIARGAGAEILYSGRIKGSDTRELGRKIHILEAVINKANERKSVDFDEIRRISGL